MSKRSGIRGVAVALLAALGLGGLLGCDLGIPGVPPGPLPGLRSEPDPVAGGRIVDAHGREVLLRGVNVNAFVEYWQQSSARPATYPFDPADADLIAGLGWNTVRLLVSWSRVEPEPGVYDEAHLDEIEAAVVALAERGVYSIVDLHQDAWGPTLAAAPGTVCTSGTPAFGWDGAPGWATLDGGAPRCQVGSQREFSLAVLAAFAAFWDDRPGPGGVGIRTRYVRMLAHLAARFSKHDAVAGYDLMNEPNAWWFAPGAQLAALGDFYGDAIAAIRAAEDAAGAPHRLVFFEPAVGYPDAGPGLPEPFAHDGQIVFAPHLYRGGLDASALDRLLFEQARADAARYGGAPVLVGEWGGDPARAADPGDAYFDTHLALQDEFRFGATLWTWREACGDPHKAGDWRDGRIPRVWGLFEVDCATQSVTGMRLPLAAKLQRGFLRHAPGRLDLHAFDPASRRLRAEGEAAADGSFVAYVPGPAPGSGGAPRVEPFVLRARGLGIFSWREAPGGGLVVFGFVRPGPWALEIR